MTTLAGTRILVLGASGGLGKPLCAELAARGTTVIGTTHRADRLAAIAGWTSTQLVLDLADPDSIATFLDSMENSDNTLDGVIVAAGVVGFGDAVDTSVASFDTMMAINATGPIRVLTGLVPLLARSSGSFIVTLSGRIAETPMAGLSSYAASKSALHAYSIAAGRELRRLGVRWLDARPGHTETGLSSHPLFGTAMDFGAGLDPIAVARRIVDGIENDERDLPSNEFTH